MMAGLVVNIRADAFDVYIGRVGLFMPARAQDGLDGAYGNPYRVGYVCGLCKQKHETPTSTLSCFANWLEARTATDPTFRARVLSLRGKTLGCFCAPRGGLTADRKPWICHGQVILDWLERYA